MAEKLPAIYHATTVGQSRLFTEPGGWGETITYVKKDSWVDILEVEPNFVHVRVGNQDGWMYRSRVTNVKAVDPVNTPPYGVIVYAYMALADGDAPVRSIPDHRAPELITLHDGARLGLIGFENGWAKVIFKRQYGYIHSSHLREVMTVKSAVNDDALKAPLAVYTSYYKIEETEANIGRMMNIATACAKLSAITLYPGQKLDFNKDIGPYNARNGYHVAPVLADGKLALNYGGGTCQVSSTLYNVLLQLPGITVLKRRAHGANGASYLPHGVDAAVGNSALNLIYRNDYDFPIHIDASSQDGALYISMWREEDLQDELEMRRLARPTVPQDAGPAEDAEEIVFDESAISEDDIAPPDDEPDAGDDDSPEGFVFTWAASDDE